MKVILFLAALIFSSVVLASEEEAIEDIVSDKGKNRFSLHLPNYILFGAEDLKLQFSGKFRVQKDLRLFFGYSQKMFWDFYDESKPFRDINFHPELFYRLLGENKPVISLDVGYLHSSNGKSDNDSRSFDQAYLLVRWRTNIYGRSGLLVLKPYLTFNQDLQNKDIVDHIGYYRFEFFLRNLFLSTRHDFDIGLSLVSGKSLLDFDQGSMEWTLRYSMSGKKFNPDLLVQYFYGFGENLLQFETLERRLRIGLLFYF